MDKETEQLIDQTLNEFFESAPGKAIIKGTRPEYYDICPHCKKEIYERHEFTDDGGKTWRHSECKGIIIRENEAGLPPSGEEKYNKQEPGGQMGTANTATIANEEVQKKIDTQVIKMFGDSADFHDKKVRVLNATKQSLGVTVEEFTSMGDNIPQSVYLITIS